MSVFATLRRKRDRSKGAPSHGTVLVSEAKAEPKFNSTPNLHKINPSVKLPPTAFRKIKESSAVFYPDESEDTIVEDDDGERYGGFGSRRSSSATETESRGGSGSGKYGKNKGSGSGSLRHFASMISMFGSLKRTKSSRKITYGSTQTFDTEKREGTDFMRDRVHGKSPDPELLSTISTSQPSSESTTCLCEVDNGNGKTNLTSNTEPGVRSSSSSSDDDDSRRNSLMDNINKSSSIVRQDDEHNFDYTNTKTEEELKRTKFIIQGVKKFNMDHKKGIEFLIDHDIVQNTPDDVAKFLKYGEGLSKKAIGNYLGERIDFNEDVLQAFLDLHNFKDLILVQALREFLWSFRLPGEAQKIDRMMEAFAKRYCQSNPGIFTCSDTCYLLSYSVIMLNTLLHNPSVKDKPTLERFVLMNRDVDSGKSLNKAFLVHLYNSILAEPFKIPPEDANDLVLTFFNPDIEGWLWKQGGYKTWKRRWFILSNNCLYYFKFTTDKSPRGIIPLENVNAKEVSSSKSNELFPFILYKKSSSSMPSDVIKTCKTLSNGNTVLSQYHTITVASINQEDRRKWVQSINQNNSNSDFYDVLTLKKRSLEAARQQHTREMRSGTPPVVRTPRVRKSLISQPSTAPNFEYKDKLPPELLVPAGPHKDPNNYFKNNCAVFSSSASISSGSAFEPDSSYGSFSDISRSRSESRILDCSRDGSISSVEHDTGSLGSRGNVGAEERSPRGVFASDRKASSSDSEFISHDVRYDLPKKLSVIEESHNHSDRSSSSSGANVVEEDSNSHPVCIGYRKLSEEIYEGDNASHSTGAYFSDSAKCDNNFQTPYKRNTKCPNPNVDINRPLYLSVTEELSSSKNINKIGNEISDDVLTSTTIRYSRSGSIESDV
ncbi:Cytohesin-2 [Orchesella cincta]|uniref:Cytohesin-2 n=1 Tax=Orchesella cincta TaxID=48709 RepID=A0A1D2NE30_ORCCI|nr:Cytohesin-2 [Orchesella cincta]